MKYVERVLQPGESVVYATTLHWLVYSRAVLFGVLGIVAWLYAGSLSEQTVATSLKLLAGLLFLLALLAALRAVILRATTELAVTDRRVIYKRGIFQRHSMEMNRSKVETVGVNQSISGRILGYGTVVVRGTGGSFEPIPYIGDPLTFRSHITAG